MNRTTRNDARRLWAPVLALVLAGGGCGLNEVDMPEFDGPAELGTSVTLTASPDIVVADGFSTALVQATVRDQNGRPVSGRPIFFSVADALGRSADIGSLRSGTGTGVGTGITQATNSQGIAQVIYESPARTDATANQTITIAARPVGTDANAALYREVRIELRSAEPRLFPQDPTNTPPTCFFIIEPAQGPYRVRQTISFQTRSADLDGTIVRYEWFFGDGTRSDRPDVAKVYLFSGTYTVTHVVTDNVGGQSACSAAITIVP
jgi:hypothetical protein